MRGGRLETRLYEISRTLTNVLRHGRDGGSAIVDPGGWAEVQELCQLRVFSTKGCTASDLRTICDLDRKGRFELATIRGSLRIRAVQGWSAGVGVTDEALVEVFPESMPELLFHGTYRSYEASILENGLVCGDDLAGLGIGDRLHVHWHGGSN